MMFDESADLARVLVVVAEKLAGRPWTTVDLLGVLDPASRPGLVRAVEGSGGSVARSMGKFLARHKRFVKVGKARGNLFLWQLREDADREMLSSGVTIHRPPRPLDVVS